MRLFMDADRELAGGWNDPPSTRDRTIDPPGHIMLALSLASLSFVVFCWFYLYFYL